MAASISRFRPAQVVDDDERTMLSDVFRSSRGIHEHFMFDQRWVVTASTFAMLVLIVIGLLMGWPRIRNTVSGWHQGMAWFGPASGGTFAANRACDRLWRHILRRLFRRTVPPCCRSARRCEMLGEKTDISGLIWLRTRGGRLLARVNEGGVFRVYQVCGARCSAGFSELAARACMRAISPGCGPG